MAWFIQSTDRPTAEGRAPLPSQEPKLPSGMPAAPTALPSTATNRVRLQIRTEPVAAELYLDGQRVINPLDQEREPSLELHQVEVRAAGFHSVRSELRLDHSTVLQIALEPEKIAHEGRPTGRSKPVQTDRAEAPAVQPASPPADVTAPAVPAAAPAKPAGSEDEILGKRQLRRIGL
jgi:hypothetical protein